MQSASDATTPGDGVGAGDGAEADLRRRRMLWHCRRGMKELDVLLRRYATERYPGTSLAQQRAFEAFLELPDPQINAYLLGYEVPQDPEQAALLEVMRGG